MTVASELISQVRLSDVYTALIGTKPRRTGRNTSRGPATWRGGEGFNVALDDSRGTWYDHVTGDHGGVLALIQRVRCCTRSEALRWLSDSFGLPLDNKPMSRAERERYKRACDDAIPLARSAWLWYQERLADLDDLKCSAVDLQAGTMDVDLLATAAQEHHRLSGLDAVGVVREYVHAQRQNPDDTAALVAVGRHWSHWVEAAVVLLIEKWATDRDRQ